MRFSNFLWNFVECPPDFLSIPKSLYGYIWTWEQIKLNMLGLCRTYWPWAAHIPMDLTADSFSLPTPPYTCIPSLAKHAYVFNDNMGISHCQTPLTMVSLPHEQTIRQVEILLFSSTRSLSEESWVTPRHIWQSASPTEIARLSQFSLERILVGENFLSNASELNAK